MLSNHEVFVHLYLILYRSLIFTDIFQVEQVPQCRKNSLNSSSMETKPILNWYPS